MTVEPMYIDGEWVRSKTAIGSFDPSTGEVWTEISAGDATHVDRAVNAAHRAMTTGPWAVMTPAARGSLIHDLARAIANSAEQLAKIETRDTGKLIRETTVSCGYVPAFFD